MKRILTIFLISIFIISYVSGQSEHDQDEIAQVNKIERSNILLINGLFGASKVGVGIRYKSLYHLNEIVKVGWGVGIEGYSSNFDRKFIPVSVDVVGDIFQKGSTPFYMLSAGYGIALKENQEFANESRGGLMVDFSIGYRYKSDASQPFLALGYRLQNAYYTGGEEYIGDGDKDVVYKRWSLSMGLVF